jgi:hypothetical protein
MYRFFFLPPLYLALIAFLFTLGHRTYLWVALVLAVFALGTNLFPYFFPHYLAAATSLFILASVAGLQRLVRLRIAAQPVGADAARILLLLCAAQFSVWYTLHLVERQEHLPELLRYETWDAINHTFPERRSLVARQLAHIPGRLLVFVHYGPHHVFQDEWVWNRANIDGARVVFARDLGAGDNQSLIRYYSGRTVLQLEPDLSPPRLSAYASALQGSR